VEEESQKAGEKGQTLKKDENEEEEEEVKKSIRKRNTGEGNVKNHKGE